MIVHVDVNDLNLLIDQYSQSYSGVDINDPCMKEFNALMDRLDKKIRQAEERERRKLVQQCLRMLKNED